MGAIRLCAGEEVPDMSRGRHVTCTRGRVRGVLGGARDRGVPAVRRRVRLRRLRAAHAQVCGVPHAARAPCTRRTRRAPRAAARAGSAAGAANRPATQD